MDFRSCRIVFIHIVRGRPGGLLQLSKEEAVTITCGMTRVKALYWECLCADKIRLILARMKCTHTFSGTKSQAELWELCYTVLWHSARHYCLLYMSPCLSNCLVTKTEDNQNSKFHADMDLPVNTVSPELFRVSHIQMKVLTTSLDWLLGGCSDDTSDDMLPRRSPSPRPCRQLSGVCVFCSSAAIQHP